MTDEFERSSAGDELNGDYLRSAANSIALEHALLAMLRCLCAASPDVAASVACTMRASADLLHDGDAEQRLVDQMTDQLASLVGHD